MDWRDSLANARVLDAWRHAIGLEFDQEKPDRQVNPVHGRPLQAESSNMAYDQLEGIDKPISRLVMGCDNQPNAAHAFVMFDDFFEAGGNTFDTAYIYGGGTMERFLGHWIDNRGLRDDVVVIGKGAHTPLNDPEHVPVQLNESLERLQTDHLDLYFLHRDNPDVAVGEWIEVLNREREAGRIRAFGASNWSLARIQAANNYATQHGLQGFVAISNNFSLAQMIDPVWPGCVAASDSDFAMYLESQQLSLFPWSSQARGFFTGRADTIRQRLASDIDTNFGNQPSDAEMQRCWFSDDNWTRRDRATELAVVHGVEPINIALAYVLTQPFPCFPLIGPRQLSETRSSLGAMSVDLSVDERRWLNLELTKLPAS
jgi:aryl-alcohol dehydrogenase-like predicted oxidoreductase